MTFAADTLGISSGSSRLLRELIHERLGLFYDDARLDQLADRLAPLVVERGLRSFLDYYYLLRYDPAGEAEWHRVMNALAVNETYFWREIDQLRALVDVAVPQLVESLAGAPLQIWSVPCATGEEPLTVAMLLEEAGWFSHTPIRIIGSDASSAALDKARKGRYRERSFRNLPAAMRDRYFTRADDEWQVDDTLHHRITWDQVNLLNAADVTRWGCSPIILCRNVFIYFSDHSIRRVVDLLHQLMPAQGYLAVGASESLIRISDRFELQDLNGAFVYCRPDAERRRDEVLARRSGSTGWSAR